VVQGKNGKVSQKSYLVNVY